MISRQTIRKFANEVGRRFKPVRIILFGSYAYGRPTPDSDVDLPKTHDLLDLLKRLLTVEPGWAALSPQLTQLVNYAVVFRYPGISASKTDAWR